MPTPYAFDLRCEGASHKKQNKGCQDYSLHVQEESYCAAIVCDGHGGSDYVRSATGSELAANVANKLIQSFVAGVDVSRLKNPDEREKLLKKLKERIIEGWKVKVREHYSANPFTESESAGLSEKARKRYFEEKRVEVAYGTTLLAAVRAKDYWLGLHIGDGRCVYVNNDSEFREIPLDERCFLNATTSICDKDALERFHHVFSEELPAAVFVGCDGIDGSFGDSAKLYNFYKTVLYTFATEDPRKAEAGLKDYLPRLSASGSGDDVSIAAVLDLDAIKKLDIIRSYDPGKAKAQKEENLRKEAERNEREREYLAKTADLKNEIRNLQAQYDAKAKELADVGEEMSDNERKISQLEARRTETDDGLAENRRKLVKLQDRLNELQKTVSDLSEERNRVQGKWKEAEYRKTKLETRQSGLKRDFANLKAELEGKKSELDRVEKEDFKRREEESRRREDESGRGEEESKRREEESKRREGESKRREEEQSDLALVKRAKEARREQGRREQERLGKGEQERLEKEKAAFAEEKAAFAEEKAALEKEKAAVADKASELARKEEEIAAQTSPSALTAPEPTPYPMYSPYMPAPYSPYGAYPTYPPQPQAPPFVFAAQQTPAVQSAQTPPAAPAVQTPAAQQSQPSYEQLLQAEATLKTSLQVQMDLKKEYEKAVNEANHNITLCLEQNAQSAQPLNAAVQQEQNKAQSAQQSMNQTEAEIQRLAKNLQTVQEQLRLYAQQTPTQGSP